MPDDNSSNDTGTETGSDSGTGAVGDDLTLPGATPDTPPAKKAAAKRAPAKKAAAKKTTTRKTAAKKVAAPVAEEPAAADPVVAAPVVETPRVEAPEAEAPTEKPAKKAPAKRTTRKVAAKKVAMPVIEAPVEVAEPVDEPVEDEVAVEAPAAAAPAALLFQAPEATAKAPARRSRKRAEPRPDPEIAPEAEPEPAAEAAPQTTEEVTPEATELAAEAEEKAAPSRSRGRGRGRGRGAAKPVEEPEEETAADVAQPVPESLTPVDESDDTDESDDDSDEGDNGDNENDAENDSDGGGRRRRRRGGRRRRKAGDGETDAQQDQGGQNAQNGRGNQQDQDGSSPADDSSEGAGGSDTDEGGDGGEGSSRRRRRRRRGDDGDDTSGSGGSGGRDGAGGGSTRTRERRPRNAEDEITSISGSTRLEAKKQRRRDGREAGRRRAPIVSEAEFLARREAVDRVMVVRQRGDLTQIGVLEDKVLVEHYVARESQTSLIGNVYLGRVQNVLPSMEAAFIDIGKGRNAVLYAGEVNWSSLGHKDGQARKIESVLSSGQPILVQVTKDPIGQKGARLSSQVSLAGRFLVYVPDGTTSGISRKLPDTERTRLKTLLKEIVPDTAGVIVRTAAEGASEDELTRDVERLKARWEDIESKVKGSAPQLLYGEPDLTLKVVRDLFTEDFSRLVIEGDDAWDTVQSYVSHVAPDLEDRLERYESENGKDIFAAYRVEEQIAKGLDRKVWLPSGGSLVIDRTEAMTVVDVNTGKFTGSGGNLEETVTKNNLEAAEEIVRQLRLRDIGGIIVVDFIDMVLESNRDLVLRRMVECLGRDRTRHQVAEVTSLGLVQMTRKRIGTGLVESFSENCSACQGRGVVIHEHPVEPDTSDDDARGRGNAGGRKRGRGRGGDEPGGNGGNGSHGVAQRSGPPTPKDIAAMARHDNADRMPLDEQPAVETPAAAVETPAAAPSVEETPVEVVATPVDASSETAPVVAEAPRVVTRTRGRRSGRSAGQPETPSATAVEAAPVVEAPAPVEAPAAVEATVPAPDTAPAPPKVVTRTRGRSSASRPAGQPETPATPVETAETVPVAEAPAPVDAPEPAAETAPAPETSPAPPKVVTRTRGRSSASRPAGQPAAVEPTMAVAAPAAEPVAVPAAAAVTEAPLATEPPRVVTRTRGRSASRPAGPPEGDPVDGSGVNGSGADAEAAPDGEDAGAAGHVPVKKRGTRKR